MKRDHIHIPFAEQKIRLLRGTRPVQAVQIPSLVEYHSLRGIQVLGLSVAHNPAAESDHPAVHIHNRKHNAVPELVGSAVAFVHADQPRLRDHVRPIPLGLQILVQKIAVLVRVPQSECADRIVAKPSVLQIGKRLRTLAVLKLHIIILRRRLIDL